MPIPREVNAGSRIRTHYELLGISPTANPREIRSAYLRLMKEHHPDRVGTAAEQTAFASLVNRCYSVLRDPAKRADYDAQLRQPSAPIRAAAPPPPPVPRKPYYRRAAWGGIVLVAAAVLSVSLVRILATGSFTDFNPAEWIAREPSHGESVSRIEPAEIRRQVQLAMQASTSEAIHVSSRCFDEAKRRQDFPATEGCIAFDDAFLYAHVTGADPTSVVPYFTDSVVAARHNESLAGYDVDSTTELNSLRDVTFRHLMDQVQRGDR